MLLRILLLNFVAIHTTLFSGTQVLYDLAAADPSLQDRLFAEIEASVTPPITKPVLTGLKKLDSLIRESMRCNGVAITSAVRKAREDFVFTTVPGGLRLPKGSYVLAPAEAMHMDESRYPDAHTFDAERFSKMREVPGHEARHQAISVDADYLPFGVGKHACPGRFFAVNEVSW